MKYRLILLSLFATAYLAAQPVPRELPRFRAGANLVSVDAYVSKDGVPVTGLTPDDFEILEDDQPQKVEAFRLIPAQGTGERRPDPLGSTDDRDAARDPDARVFVLFFDHWHINFEGASRTASPVAELLNRIIGDNDLIALMTPAIPARGILLTRRTSLVYAMVKDTLNWGERDKVTTPDPRERELEQCYPDGGVAAELIARRREQKTLRALDDLVTHLGSLRDERKVVFLLSEGWPLFKPSERLAAQPAPDPEAAARGSDAAFALCERDRALLAGVDHGVELRRLAQRANRANVTFYSLGPRGLLPNDNSIGPRQPVVSDADRERLLERQAGLRELAEQTDGAAVLDRTDVRAAASKMRSDLTSYYLLSYYSSNTKLDGRFRSITVRARRDDVSVRARAGYLAPTEADVRGMTSNANVRPATPASAPTLSGTLNGVPPARGTIPARIQASAATGRVLAIVELDPSTVRRPEWITGGSLRISVEPERGFGTLRPIPVQVLLEEMQPGQRSFTVTTSEGIAPGRYAVRAEFTPNQGRVPIQATTFVTVPNSSAFAGSAALALRRGPSTGLAYVSTADPRFRRTERLRVEVPVVEGTQATARILTKGGQQMPLVVTYSTRSDEATRMTMGIADVVLAPLAAGEYVLQLSFENEGRTASVAYGFRIIP